jgi:hypothetical protein
MMYCEYRRAKAQLFMPTKTSSLCEVGAPLRCSHAFLLPTVAKEQLCYRKVGNADGLRQLLSVGHDASGGVHQHFNGELHRVCRGHQHHSRGGFDPLSSGVWRFADRYH